MILWDLALCVELGLEAQGHNDPRRFVLYPAAPRCRCCAGGLATLSANNGEADTVWNHLGSAEPGLRHGRDGPGRRMV